MAAWPYQGEYSCRLSIRASNTYMDAHTCRLSGLGYNSGLIIITVCGIYLEPDLIAVRYINYDREPAVVIDRCCLPGDEQVPFGKVRAAHLCGKCASLGLKYIIVISPTLEIFSFPVFLSSRNDYSRLLPSLCPP